MPKHLLNWIRLIAICLAVASCSSIPKPIGHVSVIHNVGLAQSYQHQYDMQTDFDDDLHVMPGHGGVHVPLSLDCHELDRGVFMDTQSYANALAFWQKLHERYKNCTCPIGN